MGKKLIRSFILLVLISLLVSQAQQKLNQIQIDNHEETTITSVMQVYDSEAVQLSTSATLLQQNEMVDSDFPPVIRLPSPLRYHYVKAPLQTTWYATDTSRMVDVMKYHSNYLSFFHV
ncbi:hypothetical protein [Virgibacillus proomii]|uniref:hypothetical protein n=1 Tax=Virgibacillus proomii TaxID=84407 RepID=UPI001C10865E|nr:hypothetical protein [Virgibacillus proomii]MBU5267870.1 hypothetical protein [Virgibacillus proomii]